VEVQAAHDEQMRASTRTTALAGGVIILVAWPLWALYDQVAAPEEAGDFLVLRLLVIVPILALWLLLLRKDFGERHAPVLAVLAFGLPQVAIAWMLPRVGPAFEGYLLGFSLVVYGSAFLLVGRLRMTAILMAITWASITASFLLHPSGDFEIVTVIFYLGTASLLAFVGRCYKIHLERRELAARLALEREQERTLVLVGELDRLSREDFLTGVANRRMWDESLVRACAESERTGRPLSVLLLDIDHFKEINDRYGHRRGDEVLREVSGCLSRRVRTADLLARVGGDEFAVLCPDTSVDDARRLGGELARLVDELPGEPKLAISVGAAAGAASCTPEQLMVLADRRLYEAKRTRDVACVAGGVDLLP